MIANPAELNASIFLLLQPLLYLQTNRYFCEPLRDLY